MTSHTPAPTAPSLTSGAAASCGKRCPRCAMAASSRTGDSSGNSSWKRIRTWPRVIPRSAIAWISEP
jgi:hypothetical protein